MSDLDFLEDVDLGEETIAPQAQEATGPLSRSAIHEVVGKLLLDQGFRSMFNQDPKLAIENAGVVLTANEFSAVIAMAEDLGSYANSEEVKELADRMVSYVDRIYISPTSG